MATGKIAFQGELGAYSHLACLAAYPTFEPLPRPSFDDAFSVVLDGLADLAMIPIENTLGGRVAAIHNLLPESRLHIVNEHYEPIHHCLLAAAGVTKEGLARVESHEQALSQCRAYIRGLGLVAVASADTAGGCPSSRGTGGQLLRRDRVEARSRDLRARRVGGACRGSDWQHHPFRGHVARAGCSGAGRRPLHELDRVPGPQRPGRAVQGARRVCDERG